VKKQKKVHAVLVGLVALSLAVPKAAQAQSAADFGRQFTLFVELYNDFTGFINATTKDVFPQVEKEVSEAFNASLGVLGIMSPVDVRDKLKANITADSRPDSFISNLSLRRDFVGNETDRQLVRASVQSNLGKAGQKKTQQELTFTQEDVQDTILQAETGNATGGAVCAFGGCSQPLPTWNQQRALLEQVTDVADVLGGIRSDALEARQDAQWSNILNAQSAEGIDEQNRVRAGTSNSEAVRVQLIGAQTTIF
jgi:hypothetical protein